MQICTKFICVAYIVLGECMKRISLSLFLMFFTVFVLANVTQVEAQYVCMVNNTVFDRPQIPVIVNNKTYYGCCAGCKDRLTNDAAIRTARDPISNNEVDKSIAIYGAASDGKVYYFENTTNLEQYRTNHM